MATVQSDNRLISQLLLEDADLRDIVEQFVDGLSGRINELKAAYERLDWDALRTLAHRLKGAGGSYGYPELSRIGAHMEENFKAQCAGDFALWIKELEELTAACRSGLQDG